MKAVEIGAVFAAGGIGSVLRFVFVRALAPVDAAASSTAWPLGTQLVNVLGCFAIGVAAVLLEGKQWLGVDARVLVGTGLLGGFTTYSAFNLEVLELATHAEGARALLYAGSTLVVCLGAGLGGLALGRAL